MTYDAPARHGLVCLDVSGWCGASDAIQAGQRLHLHAYEGLRCLEMRQRRGFQAGQRLHLGGAGREGDDGVATHQELRQMSGKGERE